MNNKFLKELCILIVSYESEKKINLLLKNISKNISILIVENSRNFKLKTKIEKKFKNVNVLIPKDNLGFANSLNFATKKIKKKYIMYMDSDVNINTKSIYRLLTEAKKVKRFGAITPKIYKQNYKDLITKKNKNGMHEVSYNTGCVMLFKTEILKKMNYFDNSFFLYFEELDYYKRCIEAKYPIFMYDKVTITHGQSASIDVELRDEYRKIRNWHYCWSKFFYYKKHFGYLTGLSKTLPNIIKSIKKILICILKLEFKKIPFFYAELEGLFCSYLNIRPFYRIKKS